MHFTIFSLVILLAATSLSLALPEFLHARSEVTAFESPKSNSDQDGDVRRPNPFLTTTIDKPSQEEATTDPQMKQHHHDPTIRKRHPSREINFCPPGKVCVRSSCRPHTNAQAYAILCRDPKGIVTFEYGECVAFEMCIEGRLAHIGAMGIHIRAHCVSRQNFVDIATVELGAQDHAPARIAKRVG